MNGLRIVVALLFALVLAIWVSACSDEESDRPPEVDAEEVSADTESVTQEPMPSGDEFVLTEAVPLTTGLAAAYEEACIDEDAEDFGCSVFRSLVIVELVMAFEEIERSRDQRGADDALAALDLTGEPDVLVAALRVLGPFADTPGIREEALPLMLESPWVGVQEMAARVLSSNPDPDTRALASYWLQNHGDLASQSAYDEYPDFPPHYFDMEFPEYPGAEWFSPADADRAVGWWTADDAATVTAWLAEALDVQPLGSQQWAEHMAARYTAMLQAFDQAKMDRVQELSQEYLKTQDPGVLEEVEQLQAEMAAQAKGAQESVDNSVINVSPPSIAGAYDQARYFIVEEQAGQVDRLVIVYPLASFGRTVIQHVWDLSNHPSAWPQPDAAPVEE